jgi:hypothetical protein
MPPVFSIKCGIATSFPFVFECVLSTNTLIRFESIDTNLLDIYLGFIEWKISGGVAPYEHGYY